MKRLIFLVFFILTLSNNAWGKTTVFSHDGEAELQDVVDQLDDGETLTI